MSMLEMQASLSGMANAFEAQKNVMDVMHKSLGAADGAAKPVQALPEQAQNTVDARAVTGLGNKIDISV